MARRLPPLAGEFPAFGGFSSREDKQSQLLPLLRRLARRRRRANLQPFSARGDAAAFFGVSARTVFRVYRELEREGLLRRVRGSMTQVTPRQAQPRSAVRGVVGIPVWLPGFLTFRDWRAFVLQTEAALRRRRFVADIVFYGQNEELRPDFCQRIRDRELDAMLWFWPGVADMETILRVRDGGVPVIVLTGEPKGVPGRYVLGWQRAIEDGLRAWVGAGIRRVELLQAGLVPPNSFSGILRATLSRLGIPWRPVELKPGMSRRQYAAALALRGQTGVIADNDILYWQLCRYEPAAVIHLMRRTRVMHWRLDCPEPIIAPGVRMDLLTQDWTAIAETLAQDFSLGTVLDEARPTVFEATWRPQVSYAEFLDLVKDL